MKFKTEIFAILFTVLISLGIGFTSIAFFKDYGWSVFVYIPVVIGFLPPFIVAKKAELTKKEYYAISFKTLGIACLSLLVFALEGIICIIMALPIFLLLVWLGSYLAYVLSIKNRLNTTNISIILLCCSIGFMSFDYVNEAEELIPVKTKIIVNSSIENVWTHVVTFNKIEEPTELIFKTGISYPTNATIKGNGVGAIRYCNFTTGSFVEPITKWDEPNLLQFDVKEQPIPMNEWNPFWNIHPPHLDGYFRSYKGQFRLTKISENRTELEGTTFYKVDIYPQFYWKTWSDFIIHRIHDRVLNHIKSESEN